MLAERTDPDGGIEAFSMEYINGERSLSEMTEADFARLLDAILSGGDLFERGLAVEVIYRVVDAGTILSLPRKLLAVRTLSTVMHHPQRVSGLDVEHLSTLQKQAAHVFAGLLRHAAENVDELHAIVKEHLEIAFSDQGDSFSN